MQTAITVERRALYEEVWKSPIYRIADRLGISGAEVRKTCDALAIPVPAHNYWPRIQAGHVIHPIPLPDYPGEQSYTTYGKVNSEKEGVDATKSKVSSEQSDPGNPITISTEGSFTDAHVIKLAARLKFIDRDIAEGRLPPKRGEKYRMRSWFDGKPGGLIHPGEGYLQVIATPAMRDRALRLADGLLTALSPQRLPN